MRSISLLVVVAVVVAACGRDKDESLPPACTQGFKAVAQALQKAPGNVRIDGVTPISRCFNVGASGDEIQIVGSSMLPVAQQLGDQARLGDTEAALRLGYLVGAVDRGAKRNGLADELRRRIESEASGLGPTRVPYARGLRAGLTRG